MNSKADEALRHAWLIEFYEISTLVGYLMPNPVYTYILDKYDLLTQFADNIIKRAWAHSFVYN